MHRIRIAFARSLSIGSVLIALCLAACGRSEQQAAPAPDAATKRAAEAATAIAAALSATDRFAGDGEEDEWRHPRAVLRFLGIEPGMQVLDYFAGSGYYSELLSRTVGPSGSVIVYNNPGYAQFAGDKLVKRFADNRLANAKVVTAPTNEFKLDANSLDGVLFFWSYHDLYWQPKEAKEPMGNPAQITAMLFQSVKPGGAVVVVDHVATPGGETAKVVDALHRIDPEVVKKDFTTAGFVVDGTDDAFRNPGDDHSKLVFDPSIQHKTDQFVLKFRKPAK